LHFIVGLLVISKVIVPHGIRALMALPPISGILHLTKQAAIVFGA
jgi:hypothetical protein